MNGIKHIFWDLDHTLWDFDKNSVIALEQTHAYFSLSEKGISDFNDFNSVYHKINNEFWARFRSGSISREDLKWKRMYHTLNHYQIFDESLARDMADQYLYFLPKQKEVFPDTIETLDYCQGRGYQQHIITNGFDHIQMEKMTNSNLLPYFNEIITSEKAMSMKPRKEIFEYALNLINAKPEECIMIGDDLDADVYGALNAGMNAIWYCIDKDREAEPGIKSINKLKEVTSIL